jgi:arginine/ornithine transport system ATP-binding protein
VGEVLKVIWNLAQERGRTMSVVVTHEMGLPVRSPNQLVFLHEGVVEERGLPEEVLVNPPGLSAFQQFAFWQFKVSD